MPKSLFYFNIKNEGFFYFSLQTIFNKVKKWEKK